MNFLQFVESVRQGASVEEIAASYIADAPAEAIGVYLTPKVSLTNELAFFDLERIPPTIIIKVDGVEYEAFFSVAELADLIPEYAAFLGTSAQPLAIAKAILDYHQYDA
jgi:hypothetical protein